MLQKILFLKLSFAKIQTTLSFKEMCYRGLYYRIFILLDYPLLFLQNDETHRHASIPYHLQLLALETESTFQGFLHYIHLSPMN